MSSRFVRSVTLHSQRLAQLRHAVERPSRRKRVFAARDGRIQTVVSAFPLRLELWHRRIVALVVMARPHGLVPEDSEEASETVAEEFGESVVVGLPEFEAGRRVQAADYEVGRDADGDNGGAEVDEALGQR